MTTASLTVPQLYALVTALEAVLVPGQMCVVGHGLCVLRTGTWIAPGIPTWHVADLGQSLCVLALAVGPNGYVVQRYVPGAWEATLAAWARELNAGTTPEKEQPLCPS